MISQYIPFHMVKSGWYGGIGHGSSASSAPAAPHLWTPRFRSWDWDNMAHPAVNIWMNGIYMDLYGFLWINMEFYEFIWIYVCINVYIYISYGFMWIYFDYVLLVMDDVLILSTSNRWNMTFSLMITSYHIYVNLPTSSTWEYTPPQFRKDSQESNKNVWKEHDNVSSSSMGFRFNITKGGSKQLQPTCPAA